MSSFFKKLSKIDERTKYSVYGWVRKAEQELSLNNIPLTISNICVLYIHDEDVFERINELGRKSDDNKRVTSPEDRFWMNAYGRNYIDSMSAIKCQWDLDSYSTNCCVIGITSFNAEQINEDNGKAIWGDRYKGKGMTLYLYYGRGAGVYQSVNNQWKNNLIH